MSRTPSTGTEPTSAQRTGERKDRTRPRNISVPNPFGFDQHNPTKLHPLFLMVISKLLTDLFVFRWRYFISDGKFLSVDTVMQQLTCLDQESNKHRFPSPKVADLRLRTSQWWEGKAQKDKVCQTSHHEFQFQNSFKNEKQNCN